MGGFSDAESAALLAAACLGLYIAGHFWDDLAPSDGAPDDQTTNTLQDLAFSIDGSNASDDSMTNNRQAFLEAIAYAEGTRKPGGYNALFGWPAAGRSFSDMSDHPRILFPYKNLAGQVIQTSAAGRYQITKTTYDATAPKLGIRDFSAASQDAIAIELIRQRGALPDVDAGNFASAINKVRKVWASLPGAGYDQPERSLSTLSTIYAQAGGYIAA